MKAIYYNIFGLGHINPTLPLVRTLVGGGVKIIYHSSPARKELIENAGAEFRNYGYDSYQASDFNPGKNFVLQTIPATLGLLPFLSQEIERERPDFILYDSMAPWGLVLSRIYDIPAYCTVTTFALSRERRKTMMKSFGIEIDDKNRDCLEYLRINYGIQMNLEDALGAYGENNIVFTTQDFNPPLEELCEGQFIFLGPQLDREEDLSQLPYIPANKKLITMALGTILRKEDPSVSEWYRELAESFRGKEDYVVVMNGGFMDNLPTNCFSFEAIPQLHLLKRSQLFIHHGGMNSLNEGLHFKVPMIVIPHSKDQFMNAERLKEMGLGIVMNKSEVTRENFCAMIKELIP